VESFIQKLVDKHKCTHEAPTTPEISSWLMLVMSLLFPEVTDKRHTSPEDIKNALIQIESGLRDLLYRTAHCVPEKCETAADSFILSLSAIYDDLLLDVEAFMLCDPASRSTYEVVRSYPGFFAIFTYRIAHQLQKSDVPLIPRILGEYAHSKTGIDIHPSATIGQSFFIDHGTGVVIGETAIIGNHVKIYQGVTLGALSVDKTMAGVKRHPTVGDHTIIYSGATILGGNTVIGRDCIIGGNVWLTTSVPDGTKVYHSADNKFVKKLNKTQNEEDL
jgi:serine O-acetyltransferase